MSTPLSSAVLAERLPGRWRIVATNFPMWLKGDKVDPVIEYGLQSDAPLTLSDKVEYVDELRGDRNIEGVDRSTGDDGFVWRGAGILKLLRSRWSVIGIDDDVMAIRFARSLVTPAGVDVLVRDAADLPEVRRHVAEHPELLGLTMEEFAGLSWLERRH